MTVICDVIAHLTRGGIAVTIYKTTDGLLNVDVVAGEHVEHHSFTPSGGDRG